jgi:hypothetical protein
MTPEIRGSGNKAFFSVSLSLLPNGYRTKAVKTKRVQRYAREFGAG